MCNGLTHKDRPPDHDRFPSTQIIAKRIADQHHTAKRGATDQSRKTTRQPSRAHDMQPVNILVRVNRAHHRKFIEMLWQWQLNEDAVNAGVSIERFNQRNQIGLRRISGQLMLKARHANLKRLPRLVAHIHRTRRIFTHEHNRKPRHPPRRNAIRRHALCNPRAEPRRMGFPINDRRCHPRPLGDGWRYGQIASGAVGKSH